MAASRGATVARLALSNMGWSMRLCKPGVGPVRGGGIDVISCDWRLTSLERKMCARAQPCRLPSTLCWGPNQNAPLKVRLAKLIEPSYIGGNSDQPQSIAWPRPGPSQRRIRAGHGGIRLDPGSHRRGRHRHPDHPRQPGPERVLQHLSGTRLLRSASHQGGGGRTAVAARPRSRCENRGVSDQHAPGSRSTDRGRLLSALALVVCLVAIEIVAGLLPGSLPLLSDAGHMLTDPGPVGMSLLAIRLAAHPPSGGLTYGLKRAQILTALANRIALIANALVILDEAVHRLLAPPAVAGGYVIRLSGGGGAGQLCGTHPPR